MTQGDKNKLLIILLAILVAVSVFLGLSDSNTKRTAENRDRYAVEDTASIERITLRSAALDIHNVLQRTEKGWTINEVHKADPNIVQVLMSVLHQVRVARPLPKSRRKAIRNQLPEEGIEVQIWDEEGRTQSFYVLGNSTKTQTVFAETAQGPAHLVLLPGYDSYVAGIFEVTALDWRNRTVFSSTWRSLQRLEILYPDMASQNVEIRFTIDFFEITGIEKIDTVAMMEFLEDLQFFQATRFIQPKEGEPYDSLLQTEPLAIVSVDDVVESRSNRVILYPALPGSDHHLGLVGSDQTALFDRKAVDAILKEKRDFTYESD